MILGIDTANSLSVPQYTEVKVSAGDTLWSISEEYMPQNSDIRESVYQLCRLNDISADELYAGMTILVPVHESI